MAMPLLFSIGGVGVTLFVASHVTRQVVDRFANGALWYAQLEDRRKTEMARALTCVMHHSVVSIGALVACWTDNPDLLRGVLLIELGFDVYDTFATIAGQGLTGMGAVPVTIHHTVALVLDYVGLFTDIVPWRSSAAMAAILLGSGALDLTVVRIVRHTPIYHSASMLYLSAVQFALFLALRVGYFSSTAVRLLGARTPSSSRQLIGVPFVLLSLYHFLLGTGLVFALKNGGRMPEKPAKY